MTLRLAIPADGAELARIYQPYVTETAITFETTCPTAAEMSDRVEQALGRHAWLVLADGQRLAGYAYAGTYRSRAAYDWTCETAIYLDQAHRSQGGGRQLYQALLPLLADLGYCQALACLTLPNPASQAFHQALGFRFVGPLPATGFKLGRWHDTGLFQRALTASDRPPSPLKTLADLDPVRLRF